MADEFKYVVGNDPGGTSGVACLRYTDDTLPELIYLHQIPDGKEGYWGFFRGSNPVETTTIVSESFTIREGVHGADVTPLRIEGIQYTLWEDSIEYQEPKMKALVKDKWLKEQNLWTPGKPHQMDALRHAIVWLRNSGHKPTIEALSDMAEEPIEQPGEAKKKELNEDGSGKPEEVQSDAEKMAEAVRKIMEEMDGEGDPSEADGEPTGQTQEQGDGEPVGDGGAGIEGDYENVPDPKDKRKRIEKNGVFVGYEADTGGVEVELYSD